MEYGEALEHLLTSLSLSEDSILQRVDEYTLYCFYLGFEPVLRRPYRSPLREGDDMPSFSVFSVKGKDREYFWKDSGGDGYQGVAGDSGDIFKLIKRMYGDTSKQCYSRINRDFDLGFESSTPPPKNFEKIVRHALPKDDVAANIRVKYRAWKTFDMAYWGTFGVTLPTLNRYLVKPISFFWTAEGQPYPYSSEKHSYVYHVHSKKKIYQPFSKARKFRNDLTDKELEGYPQLPFKSDTLIITKSTKDIMLLHELGIEAVSPRGESVPIHEAYLSLFGKKYKRVATLFDNDGKHRADSFPFPALQVPLESKEKDISDFRKAYGEKLTRELINDLILSI